MRKVKLIGTIDGSARDQLLTAASQIMTERGAFDVSLSEIAQKSGLNSALVKYYFGNKSGLLMALLRKIIVPINKDLDHLLTLPVSAREKMRIHISAIVNTCYKFPYINRLMHHMLAEDPELFGPMIAEEFSRPVADAQRRILEDGVREGLFRPVDPVLFYFQVVGACDQLFFARFQLEYVFGRTSIDEQMKRDFIDHHCATVFNGILAKPGAHADEH